jgi:hypothetical protein
MPQPTRKPQVAERSRRQRDDRAGAIQALEAEPFTAGPSDRHIMTAVVDDISPDGVARIILSGEEQSRDAASVLRFPSADAAAHALLGSTVLVLANPSSQPVILGVVTQRVWEQRDAPEVAEATLPAGVVRSVELDKRCVNFEASEEIRLTCGKSSLVMRRDGSVIVRGVSITSRATQSNKIRGGTVAIN